MPTYDYRCDANGRDVEVRHRMSENAFTWGELCELAGFDPGSTPLDAPVRRLATGGNVVTGKSGRVKEAPPCGVNGGCSGGMCGLNG